MLTILSIMMRPVIGAVIGYITNDIAIRMLFRPRKAKYILGIHVPFTPGIIPKEKGRIAASIGEAISKNLMNREVLERTLLSDDMISKITSAIDSFAATQRSNDETLRKYLLHYLSSEEIEQACKGASSGLSRQIHNALAESPLGSQIARMVISHAIDKTRSSLFGRFGADQFLAVIAAPAEKLLAKNIDSMLREHSAEMVDRLVGDQFDSLLSTPMRRIFTDHADLVDNLSAMTVQFYRMLITERLPRVLEAVNISRIVETRILEMDERESERLILEVMNKELRAIVWLGALLGFIMGCINLLF